jgi:hypothetical protein
VAADAAAATRASAVRCDGGDVLSHEVLGRLAEPAAVAGDAVHEDEDGSRVVGHPPTLVEVEAVVRADPAASASDGEHASMVRPGPDDGNDTDPSDPAIVDVAALDPPRQAAAA